MEVKRFEDFINENKIEELEQECDCQITEKKKKMTKEEFLEMIGKGKKGKKGDKKEKKEKCKDCGKKMKNCECEK